MTKGLLLILGLSLLFALFLMQEESLQKTSQSPPSQESQEASKGLLKSPEGPTSSKLKDPEHSGSQRQVKGLDPKLSQAEQVKALGLLGQAPSWLERTLEPKIWVPLKEEPLSFIAFGRFKVIWRLKEGLLRGARVELPEGSEPSELAGLGDPFLGGQGGSLPEPIGGADISKQRGRVETRDGRHLYYELEFWEEPPYGPRSFEISLDPHEPL